LSVEPFSPIWISPPLMFAISGLSFGLQHHRIGRIFGRQPKSHFWTAPSGQGVL
jgi:hypothetical protein